MEIWDNLGEWSLFLHYKRITQELFSQELSMPGPGLDSCTILHGVMGVSKSTLHVFCIGLGKSMIVCHSTLV